MNYPVNPFSFLCYSGPEAYQRWVCCRPDFNLEGEQIRAGIFRGMILFPANSFAQLLLPTTFPSKVKVEKIYT